MLSTIQFDNRVWIHGVVSDICFFRNTGRTPNFLFTFLETPRVVRNSKTLECYQKTEMILCDLHAVSWSS
uniref:Uncharacterized protein n=1 Tax=Siphoviridae sp. ctkyp1 TaxID=2825646 RepID=A0A8S5P5J6_9CAUD|nr:MAG TPA: hypothetical protein [Siphoviridae sp. ctkyp1]DAH31656.1 MAG TPA: hypothetical protein [Caudoviricetes sp.]DAH50134.1 MAG TPA: hypothetical protein [Caudoviricetes sp.]